MLMSFENPLGKICVYIKIVPKILLEHPDAAVIICTSHAVAAATTATVAAATATGAALQSMSCPLDSEVGDRRVLVQLSSMLDHKSHSLQDVLSALDSRSSDRLNSVDLNIFT